MTDIIAKHGKSYTMSDDDMIEFSAPLASLVGEPRPAKGAGMHAYKFGPTGTAYINRDKLFAVNDNRYSPKAPVVAAPSPPPPPVVVPPVVTPPASADVVANADGSIYARLGGTVIGINGSGALNSFSRLPADWPHSYFQQLDKATGQKVPRDSAGLQIAGTEYVQPGAVLQGALIRQGANVYRQHTTTVDAAVITGSNDGLTWTGTKPGLSIRQTITADGKRLRVEVTLTNPGGAPITRYDWFGDFNPSETALALASVTATSAVQGAISITSSDPRAIFYLAPVIDPRPATVMPLRTIVSAAKARDGSIGVGFLLNIAQGASDTVSFEVGLK